MKMKSIVTGRNKTTYGSGHQANGSPASAAHNSWSGKLEILPTWRPRAFTLIELLIVVAIIAILAAIAVPNFLEAQVRAKIARGKADMRAFATAMESYRVDNNGYINGQAYTDLSSSGGGAPLQKLTTPIPYMTHLPDRAPFGDGRTNFLAKGYIYFGGPTFFDPVSGLMNTYVSTYHYYHESWLHLDWLIYSIGPTKVQSLNATNPPFETPYDPTNGTVSIGDIVYVSGPGAGAGWHSFK